VPVAELAMEPFLPAIKSRPHIFREPDLWTLETDHFVRTSPDGARLELPLSSLTEIRIWRSSPVDEEVIKMSAHVMAQVRFGTSWYKLYGAYSDGFAGFTNQSGAVSAMIHALITAQQNNPDLTIRVGSRAEGVSAAMGKGILFVLPAAVFLPLPFILSGDPDHSLPKIATLSVLACIGSWVWGWWKIRGKITELSEAGRLSYLTPAQYLEEPPF